MKVVITGANSALGQAILRCEPSEAASPITFVAAVRSDRAAKELPPLPNQLSRVARISYHDSESLSAAFQEASAIIHLAGLLIEQPGSTYREANIETTRSVVEAVKHSTAEKLVYISAIGADQTSANRYLRSKGEAEALVRASGCPYTVLRVPLLLGRGTQGAAALRRYLNRRRAMLIGGGRNLHQPLYIDDLAKAVITAVDPDVAKNRTLDLVGPISLPDREIVKRAAHLLGRQIRIWSIPKKLVLLVLTIRQHIGQPGFSPDALQVITADTNLDPLPAATELGIQLTGIDEMIKQSVEQG